MPHAFGAHPPLWQCAKLSQRPAAALLDGPEEGPPPQPHSPESNPPHPNLGLSPPALLSGEGAMCHPDLSHYALPGSWPLSASVTGLVTLVVCTCLPGWDRNRPGSGWGRGSPSLLGVTGM